MSSPKLDSGKFLCFLIDRFTERILRVLNERHPVGPSEAQNEQEGAIGASELASWERL